jgi:type I restriction enzyme R subunit
LTGTPLELADRNTPHVFGDYISIYDIQRAVEDGATVPIYYESRLAKLDLDERERPRIDPDLEEVTEGVLGLFAAAGVRKPDICILSEEFLAEVRGMQQKHLAAELLRKLLDGEIRTRRRRNVVQARSFARLLEQALRRYQNRAIEAAQVIEEFVALAKEMREADRRGE